MGTKSEELRQDIRSCFKLINSLEEKCEARFRETDRTAGDMNSDLKVLIKEVSNLANSVQTHVVDFKRHNEEEMENYKKINEMFSATTNSVAELKCSIGDVKDAVDKISSENILRDEKLSLFEKKQEKIIKYLSIAISVIIIIYSLFESGIIMLGK